MFPFFLCVCIYLKIGLIAEPCELHCCFILYEKILKLASNNQSWPLSIQSNRAITSIISAKYVIHTNDDNLICCNLQYANKTQIRIPL